MKIRFSRWVVFVVGIVVASGALGVSLWVGILGDAMSSTRDLGRDITIEVAFLVLTVLVIERMLGRAERGRWRKLQKTVRELLSSEISSVYRTLAFTLLPFKTENANPSEGEILGKVRKDTWDEVDELAAADDEEISKLVKHLIGHQSLRYFGSQLKNHSETLGTFVDRYSAHLEPDLQARLVTLESSLREASNSADMGTWPVIGELTTEEDALSRSYARVAARDLADALYSAIKSLHEIRELGILEIS